MSWPAGRRRRRSRPMVQRHPTSPVRPVVPLRQTPTSRSRHLLLSRSCARGRTLLIRCVSVRPRSSRSPGSVRSPMASVTRATSESRRPRSRSTSSRCSMLRSRSSRAVACSRFPGLHGPCSTSRSERCMSGSATWRCSESPLRDARARAPAVVRHCVTSSPTLRRSPPREGVSSSSRTPSCICGAGSTRPASTDCTPLPRPRSSCCTSVPASMTPPRSMTRDAGSPAWSSPSGATGSRRLARTIRRSTSRCSLRSRTHRCSPTSRRPPPTRAPRAVSRTSRSRRSLGSRPCSLVDEPTNRRRTGSSVQPWPRTPRSLRCSDSTRWTVPVCR